MATDIKLYVTDGNGSNGRALTRYSQFSFSQNIDALVDTFSITLIDPDFEIKVGYYLYFDINRELVIRGLIQKRSVSINKNSISVIISGKSAALLLVEQACRTLYDYNGRTPRYIVDSLINQTQFIAKNQTIPTIYFDSESDPTDSETDFQYVPFLTTQNNTFTRNNTVTYDPDFEALSAYGEFSINAGDKVWDKISEIVTISGYQAYYKPIGDLIIGELKKERREAGVNFKLFHKQNSTGNNVLSASLSEDISDRYTEIQVMTQLEDGTNRTVKIIDKTAPFPKLAVYTVGNDQDPSKIGIEIREQQRIDGFQVNYTVSGFTQGQKLWMVNRLVHVEDEFLNIRQNLVIQSRVFTFSIIDGAKTELSLSYEKDLKNKIYPTSTVPGVEVK